MVKDIIGRLIVYYRTHRSTGLTGVCIYGIMRGMSNHLSKSILARALAQENITVEHRPSAYTASFDVANRVLILPVWKEMSDSLHDMFVGHEVGHALFTPYREKDHDSRGPWFKEAEVLGGTMNAPFVQDIINVVEDSRIERLMKDKFPGLRRDFINGYKELMDRDFFGLQGRNIADLEFADRINIHTKLGTSANVPFSDAERAIVDMVETTESFDDVLNVSRKIFEHINGQYEDMPEQENSGTSTQIVNDKDGDGNGQSQMTDKNQETSEQKTNTVPTNSNSTPTNTDSTPKNTPSPKKMETQENFKNKSQDLVDQSAKYTVYTTLPEPNLDRIILPYKTVLSEMREHYSCLTAQSLKTMDRLYAELLKKTNPLVSALIKQFEMRKAADVSKRTSVSRSGSIDCNRIFKYKVSDDIFLRNATIAEGKNHGLVMFVDWSASMGIVTEDVINQIIMLASFCRRMNIPFDVYLFTSNRNILNRHLGIAQYSEDSVYDQWKGGSTIRHNRNDDADCIDGRSGERFALVQFLSSSMTSREFNDALKYFYYLGHTITSGSSVGIPENYWQNNTPLDSTILCAMKIVPQFREKHKVQIVNTVFLTDGESGFHYFYNGYNEHSFVRTPFNKKEYRISNGNNSQTDDMLEIFRDVTQTNAIGFFITGRPSCRYFNHNEDPKKFKEQGFIDAPSTITGEKYDYDTGSYRKMNYRSHGYTRLFVIQSKNEITDVDDALDGLANDASFARIRSTFIKSVNKHNNSRAFLNRFADVIAVA